ncbi:MAG: hypothetical protein R3F56_18515 [Planctomycetota bacterium]
MRRRSAIGGEVWPGALATFFATALASPASAQSACATCSDTGLAPCSGCAAGAAGSLQFCSECARCRACGGSFVVACTCPAKDAAAGELTRRRAAVEAWGREIATPVEAAGARTLPTCRTRHFDLRFAPAGIDGCPAKDVHAQMHLYATRLEGLRAQAGAVLGVDADAGKEVDEAGDKGVGRGDDATARAAVALVRDELEAARWTAHVAGLEPQGLGAVRERAAVLRHDPRATDDDAALQRLLAHAVAHLTLDGVFAAATDPAPSTDVPPAWLAEGFAHWLEATQPGGLCETCCVLERLQPPRRFLGGAWRRGARDLLARGQLPSVADLLPRDVADFTPAHHVLAFVLVDLLTRPTQAPSTPGPAADSRGLPRAVQALRAGRSSAVALAAAGLDPASVDDRVVAFVRETYPP